MPVMVSKQQMAEWVAQGLTRESFEHSIYGLFDVTMMRRYCKENSIEPMLVTLDQITPFVRVNRVTDPDRVARLPEESWQNDPGIFVVHKEPNGEESHTMVDGSHRALRREQEGEKEMLFYFLDMSERWRPGPMWGQIPGVDWGDPIVNGKIIRSNG